MDLMDQIKKKGEELITRMCLYEIMLMSNDLSVYERHEIEKRLIVDTHTINKVMELAKGSVSQQRTAPK